MRAQPCSSCPWRVGVDAWAIGRDHTPEVPPLWPEKMAELAQGQDHGFGAKVMQCHLVHKEEEKVSAADRLCIGYALSREGCDNLNLRLLAIQGKVDLSALSCSAPLHPDYAAMIAANPARPGTEGA